MRCIEMLLSRYCCILDLRLTLTWDVLKFTTSAGICTKPTWLTLTWDVLKYF